MELKRRNENGHRAEGSRATGVYIQLCFQKSVCLRLLLAIMNGIQYVHNMGIVHCESKKAASRVKTANEE
jgi:hypothetical protein